MKSNAILSVTILMTLILLTTSCTKDEVIDESDADIIQIEVEVSGNLSSLSEDEIHSISKLTITGTITGDDWDILNRMACQGYLETLDMSKAIITGVSDSDIWQDNAIPESAFYGSKTLKEVILPQTLKSIGKEAFASCVKLYTVRFNDEIEYIGERAFYYSAIRGDLYLPKSMTKMGRQAFAHTDLVKAVISSDIVSDIYSTEYTIGGNSVFANSSILELEVAEGCTILEIGFQGCKYLEYVTLPSTLKSIGLNSEKTGNYIFYNCTSLSEITLPDNLVSIGMYAFRRIPIKKIRIPNKVKSIGIYAFSDCASLAEVVLPSSLTIIGQGCFNDCCSLANIDIPDNVNEVDYGAFEGCTSLRSVNMGKSINTIGMKAFKGCASLETIVLPSGLNALGKSAFEGCESLSSLVIPDALTSIQSTTFAECTSLESVQFGENLRNIGSSSFFHCPRLSHLIIPPSVSEIGDFAFAYAGIKEVRVGWSIPVELSPSVFRGLNVTKIKLSVPVGTSSAYFNADVWRDFVITEEDMF